MEAAEGNFLYARTLKDAVAQGRVDFSRPGSFAHGLTGLYESWFRRQFADKSAYEDYVPLLEILFASEHPVPEAWLSQIFDWPLRKLAENLENLGSLFIRDVDGVAPFHKSLRDWVSDDKRSGSTFVLDIKRGRHGLLKALMSNFNSWLEDDQIEDLDNFCAVEMLSQLTFVKNGFSQLATRLSQGEVIRRKVFLRLGEFKDDYVRDLIDVQAPSGPFPQDTRDRARHHFREFIDKVARAWPGGTDSSPLWSVVEALRGIAWETAERLPDLSMLRTFDDIGESNRRQAEWIFDQPIQKYLEWNEAILRLCTTMDCAYFAVRHCRQLRQNIRLLMNQQLRDFMRDAHQFADKIHSRSHVPDMHLSYLDSSLQRLYGVGVEYEDSTPWSERRRGWSPWKEIWIQYGFSPESPERR
jgi:hypothetical protein